MELLATKEGVQLDNSRGQLSNKKEKESNKFEEKKTKGKVIMVVNNGYLKFLFLFYFWASGNGYLKHALLIVGLSSTFYIFFFK